MDQQTLRRSMERHVNGASFITASQFQKYMGISRSTAERKLRSLEKVDGKYYFIPDVVAKMMKATH